MKKVLLVVIDALSSRVVVPALEQEQLPCLSRLVKLGTMREKCVSIFPSITPAATASIATGVYPADHHIAGAFWYNREEDCVAYYGDDFWVILEEGVQKFFDDFLIRLNHGRLNADTIYQRVERHGLTSAVLNFMWFRGETRHEVDVPLLLKLFPGSQFPPQILGPKILGLADFAASKLPGRDEPLQAEGGVMRRFGFHDETTAGYLLDLSNADPFPDFTLAYFPNNDFESHKVGPSEAIESVINVDQHLAKFIDRRGGMEQFVEEFVILVVGDHSQCDLLNDPNGRGIDLDELFEGYQLAKPGTPWEESDDLMVCPNMRSCHLYLQNRSSKQRDQVVELLLSDPRVDQVIFRKSSWDQGQADHPVDPTTDEFVIVTSQRGRLEFRHASSSDAQAKDIYGTGWQWKGDLSCIDAKLMDKKEIAYGAYPNALERISTGFSHHAGDIWVTAREGCEFALQETSIHNRGSHGALNSDDSKVPLIVAGLPEHVTLPDFPRTIDLAPLCLRVLGLDDEADEIVKNRVAGRPR